MSVKRHPAKTARHKKLERTIDHLKPDVSVTGERQSQSDEAEIIRQFHQIQKGYTRLMNDVAKELYLVKNWIGSQTELKRNDLKARFSSRLSKF